MAVQYKDYYQTLGVSKTATQDEIRTAFRKLARVHHPDVAKDKKAAESKFKEINEAYEVLGDPEKRQKYDTLGADWERGSAPQGWPGGAGRPTCPSVRLASAAKLPSAKSCAVAAGLAVLWRR